MPASSDTFKVAAIQDAPVFDDAGHYARPDVHRFSINVEADDMIRPVEED